MNILVFCSANELKENYTKPAQQFGSLLAKSGHNLVWGGSDTGLMKQLATAVQEAGGKLIGISMDILKDVVRKNADEMIIEKNLAERKATMLARADAIAVLVGGIGTLDEVTEIMELKKHSIHNKPIAVLNTDNFYSGLKTQLQKMKDEGFIQKPLEDFLYFADKPEEAMDYINERLKQ